MLTRSQTANKNCKVEKNTVLPVTKLQKVYNKPENVFTIVRTRSYNERFVVPRSGVTNHRFSGESSRRELSQENDVVDKLQNNKSVVSSIITRSKVDKEVNIDFDSASREWRRNKRSSGNGTYVYK